MTQQDKVTASARKSLDKIGKDALKNMFSDQFPVIDSKSKQEQEQEPEKPEPTDQFKKFRDKIFFPSGGGDSTVSFFASVAELDDLHGLLPQVQEYIINFVIERVYNVIGLKIKPGAPSAVCVSVNNYALPLSSLYTN